MEKKQDNLAELASLIKNGRQIRREAGVDLLGEPIVFEGTHPLSYAELAEIAFESRVTDEKLQQLIRSEGSAALLWDALESTKDFKAYASTWIKKSGYGPDMCKSVLKRLGATEQDILDLFPARDTDRAASQQDAIMNLFSSDEDFVRFYLSGDRRRMRRFISSSGVKAEAGESRVKKAFEKFGIDLNNYIHLFGEIADEQIFLDCMAGVSCKTLQLARLYVKKFNSLSKIGRYIGDQMSKLNSDYKARDYSAYCPKDLPKIDQRERFSMALEADAVGLVIDVACSKIPIMQKLNFMQFGWAESFPMTTPLVMDRSMRTKTKYDGFWGMMVLDIAKKNKYSDFDDPELEAYAAELSRSLGQRHQCNTNIKEWFVALAQPLARQYLEHICKASSINSHNKERYMLNFKYLGLGYGKGLLDEYQRTFIDTILYEGLEKGLLQELSKFVYINKSRGLELCMDDWRRKIKAMSGWHRDGAGPARGDYARLKRKYEQTESFKQMPIPFDYLMRHELMSFDAQWPAFIFARNAQRIEGFDIRLLAEPMFYEQGFKGRAFDSSNKQWAAKNGYSATERDIGFDPDEVLTTPVDTSEILYPSYKKLVRGGDVFYYPKTCQFAWVSSDGHNKKLLSLFERNGEYRFFVNENDDSMPSAQNEYYAKFWDVDFDRPCPKKFDDLDEWAEVDLGKVVSPDWFAENFESNGYRLASYDLDYADENYMFINAALFSSLDDLSEKEREEEEWMAEIEADRRLIDEQDASGLEQTADLETKRLIDYYKSLGYDDRQVQVMVGELGGELLDYLQDDSPVEPDFSVNLDKPGGDDEWDERFFNPVGETPVEDWELKREEKEKQKEKRKYGLGLDDQEYDDDIPF